MFNSVYHSVFLLLHLLTGALRFVALYSLNIEQCSITSRTIQKISDSLDAESVLEHLSLGTTYCQTISSGFPIHLVGM